MWLTDAFLDLPEECRFQYVHACMYGSQRRKSTGLLLNFEADNLKAVCDDSHPHLPWGMVNDDDKQQLRFSTSLETEYPALFCKQLVLAFLDALQCQGKSPLQFDVTADQTQKMGSGVQPRGAKAPLLMGEFKCKVIITSSEVPVPSVIGPDVHPPFQGIPLHAKLLSSQDTALNGENGEKQVVQRSTFGVYRSPWEFFERTQEVQHPLDSPQLVDKSNLEAILFIRDHSAAEVALVRTSQLKKYTQRAAELTQEEAKLKNSLDPDVCQVLQGKRLLLFKEMAAEAGVGDSGLFEELISGFSLTGEMPESKQFPAKLKPAMISVAAAVYEEMMQQLKDGWVKGPFSVAQLDEKYNHCWIPSKRFGVRQGQKIRAVDDFSEFLINASVSSTERLQLFGIDEVVNTARTFLACDFLQCDESLDWVATSPWLSSFQGPWRSIQGRALDLKAAYKQLARSPADSWASILAVWNVERQCVEFFESIALPFGSVCAVMAFNRMARALRIIMCRLFMLVNTNFFDDFCQLETDALCESSWQTAEMVVRLLGWKISLSDDKRLPFAKEFNMLGAVVDLSATPTGWVKVRNKASRVADIGAMVEDVCGRDTAPSSLLETLKGRLLYAAGHTFGRCTQLAIQLVSKLSRRGPMLLIEFRSVLRQAFSFLSDARPRQIGAWTGQAPVIVFTDGACEEDGQTVTHGATLFDPSSGCALMFGDDIPKFWTDKWRRQGKRQLICQAELFPILVAKTTWEDQLKGRPILWFIDNNSALSAMIRSFSAIFENYELLVINAGLDVKLQCMNWYSRVPSKSNLSDEPSRLLFQNLESKGFVRCQPQYKPLSSQENGGKA
eukprot:s259_g4.t1